MWYGVSGPERREQSATKEAGAKPGAHGIPAFMVYFLGRAGSHGIIMQKLK